MSAGPPLKDIEARIEQAIWEIHQIERTVEKFGEDSQTLLFNRINRLVEELGNLKAEGGKCDLEIPLGLLKAVDEGGNPDAFTKEAFRQSRVQNQVARGRAEAMAKFRDALLTEADEEFGPEAAAFRELAGLPPAGSGTGAGAGGGAAAGAGGAGAGAGGSSGAPEVMDLT